MLDRRFVVDNENEIKHNLAKRGENFSQQISEMVVFEKQRREMLQKVETIRHERKGLQQEFQRDHSEEMKEKLKAISDRIKDIEGKLKDIDEQIQEKLGQLPNVLDAKVPSGSTSDENVEVFRDEKDLDRKREVQAISHAELQGSVHRIDFDRSAKVAGSRFAYLSGDFARLERALINFMLETHRGRGYRELMVPYMANYRSLFGTGQFPKLIDDTFKVKGWDLYPIPTAEVSLVNYFQNEILDEKDLDISVVAFSPCFRSEAGSYGLDTKGLIRLHQFHKVELVKITHPERSFDALDQMVMDARHILDLLELPYRVVMLCSGDIGFASTLTYDIEVWVRSQQMFREISSLSNCNDFQARRAKIRFRPRRGGDKKTAFVHTLNGSGLAVGRTLVALVEYYQEADHRIIIPEVLRPFMGGQEVIDWGKR